MSRAQRTILIFGGISVLLVLVLVVIGMMTSLPGERTTPSGLPRNQALYVTMRDGVEIAVDVWLPEDYAKAEKLPALINPTRFWRGHEFGIGARIQLGLGLSEDRHAVRPRVQQLNEVGFAVVVVDTRGSGASFGNRPIEWSPDEIEDLREVAEWIQDQPWCDGRVGGFGYAYEASALELLMQAHPDLLHAAALEFHDFDLQGGLQHPGGVFNEALAELQEQSFRAVDANYVCDGIRCLLVKLFVQGVKPVDENGEDLLEEALADHRPIPWLEGLDAIDFRDDEFAESGLTLLDVSPAHQLDADAPPQTPILVRVGWLDAASAHGALARYQMSPQPQEVWIAPFSRLGLFDTDPFRATDSAVEPSHEKQLGRSVEFLTERFADDPPAMDPVIRFRPLGGDSFLETEAWPPENVEDHQLYLAAEHALGGEPPMEDPASDEYTVDFSATTGFANRWASPLGIDVVYKDRVADDEKLLAYTGEPLERAILVAGQPVVTLQLESTTSDGAVFVYLEAVSPTGKVVYLTEGILRFDWHAQTEGLSYPPFGPQHSGLREDAAPLGPGTITELSIGLFSIAAEIPAGYRLRLALAGHDDSVFDRIPEEGDAVWTVHRSQAHPSRVTIPWRTVGSD